MSISNVAECFYVVRIASVGRFREVCFCGAMERILFRTVLPIRNISQDVHAMGCFKNVCCFWVVFEFQWQVMSVKTLVIFSN